MQFPDDVDGDVLRRLQESGLDFSQPQTVEFIVDFCFWPPDAEALDILRKKYSSIQVFKPEDHYDGYIVLNIRELITHAFLIDTQKEITTLMSNYGGVCEAWGVLR